jgi:osmoprotectant transport system permease protein
MTALAGQYLASGGPVIPGSYGKVDTCVAQNHTFCWNWFTANWGSRFQPRLVEHVQLTLIALAIGFVISFALALLAYRAKWLAPPITFVASVLYTIPSLATFFILVPITGINWYTVEIALTSYTLLTLFTNTLAGLNGVSPEVRDAAAGIGLTRRQSLWRVELPLAVPAIIAGLRVAAVTTVSLATLAAVVVPAGLGKGIFDALAQSNFKTGFIAAGVLAVLLALAADALLVILQRVLTPWAARRRIT